MESASASDTDSDTTNTDFAELLKSVKEDGLALRDIDDADMNKQLCLAAVRQNGLALRWVPDNFMTQKVKLAAVRQNGLALQYAKIHDYHFGDDDDICYVAVQQNPEVFHYVPSWCRTSSLCALVPDVAKYFSPNIHYQYHEYTVVNGLVFEIDNHTGSEHCVGRVRSSVRACQGGVK